MPGKLIIRTMPLKLGVPVLIFPSHAGHLTESLSALNAPVTYSISYDGIAFGLICSRYALHYE